MRGYLNVVKALVNVVLFASCGILEKSSRHGFESGYFYLTSDKNSKEKVYAVITQEKLVIFPVLGKQLVSQSPTTILLLPADTACLFPIVFHRKSLDIDITSVLFKYRPARIQLPAKASGNARSVPAGPARAWAKRAIKAHAIPAASAG